MTEPIDFVVLWVDGSDPDWQRQRAQYAPRTQDNGNNVNRYRDFGLMRYWFRSIERFAPWVNQVYFVTNGQVPQWLNQSHPKLRLVSHADYIPAQYLPTFNSNVIELWLHKIPELSEHFVLLNDDTFLSAPVEPEDFFREGVPCESALLDAVTAPNPEDCLPHILINNSAVINKYFRKKDVLKQNFSKFFTLKYGKDLLRNVLLAPFQNFSAFRDPHLPASYHKSTFQELWEMEPELLESGASSRFRSKNDLSHWLMKCWQICKGDFCVRSTSWGRHYELWEDDIDGICRDLLKQKYRTICINDSKVDINFDEIQQKLLHAFDALLPEPSAFEKET